MSPSVGTSGGACASSGDESAWRQRCAPNCTSSTLRSAAVDFQPIKSPSKRSHDASWERFEGLFIGWKSTAADRNVLEVQFGAQRWRHADSSPLDAQAPPLVPTLGLNYGWAW